MGANHSIRPIRTQLAISTALASVFVLGYGGRKAHADCLPTGGGTYLCSGSTNTTQALISTPLTVTTSSDFQIITASGDALNLVGTDGTSFTDNFSSTITGYEYGMFAANLGSGTLSVVVTGTVTGLDEVGIIAGNEGTNLTIEAASVDGQRIGILTNNVGTGVASITTSGAVFGRTESGIRAVNSGTDLIIQTTAVDAFEHGIWAQNYGSGDLSITTTGLIGTENFNGIYANNYGTHLKIDAATINAGTNGINAENHGSGMMSILVSEYVKGDIDGIQAINHGTDLMIEAAEVEGENDAIYARNIGIGELSITTTGTVTTLDEYGIIALNYGTDLTINTASVDGNFDGIFARNYGTGVTSITSNGTVFGQTDAGIETSTHLGMMTSITLNYGAHISSGAGVAIKNNHGDSNVLAKVGASIHDDVILGDGSDDLTFDGGTFSNTPTFDGGDDYSSADGFVDRLTFRDVSGPATAINWEQIFVSNAEVALSGSGGDFTAPEILSLTDGSALTINGNFIGTGGQLIMDVDPANDTADVLTITGTSSGTTTISLKTGSNPPVISGNDITLVSVQGGIGSADDFVLNDTVMLGAFLFDLDTNGIDFFLTSTSLSPEIPVFEAYPQILAGLNNLSNFNQRFGERFYAAQDNAALGYALMGYAASVDLEANNMTRPHNNLVWARIEGAHSNLDPAQSTTGADYNIDQGKIRIGVDAQIAETENGLLFAGMNASFGKAFADIASAIGAGTINSTGTSAAASVTWLGSSGFYGDVQAQYSWFSSDLASDVLGTLESNHDGDGYALSLEIGQRFETATGLAVTPQAQLIYNAVDFEDFSSAFGTIVTADETDSLKLRTGVVIEHGYSVMDNAGHGGYGTISTIANVYREFREDTSVVVSSIPLNSKSDVWSGEFGLGASFTSTDGIYAIHGNASVSSGLENFADSYVVNGSAGVTLSF